MTCLGAARRNLVDNAMRYTGERHDLHAARTEHGQPLFEVRDSGSGVPRPNCRDWSSVSIAAATSLSKAVALAWRSCVASANCTGPAWKSRTSLAAASQHGCAGVETARQGRLSPVQIPRGTMRCFDTLGTSPLPDEHKHGCFADTLPPRTRAASTGAASAGPSCSSGISPALCTSCCNRTGPQPRSACARRPSPACSG